MAMEPISPSGSCVPRSGQRTCMSYPGSWYPVAVAAASQLRAQNGQASRTGKFQSNQLHAFGSERDGYCALAARRIPGSFQRPPAALHTWASPTRSATNGLPPEAGAELAPLSSIAIQVAAASSYSYRQVERFFKVSDRVWVGSLPGHEQSAQAGEVVRTRELAAGAAVLNGQRSSSEECLGRGGA